MTEHWKRIPSDFTVTGEDAQRLANCKTDEEVQALLKAIIRKRYNLPPGAEIDLSNVHITAAKKPESEA